MTIIDITLWKPIRNALAVIDVVGKYCLWDSIIQTMEAKKTKMKHKEA